MGEVSAQRDATSYVPRRMKVVKLVECTGLEIRCGVMRHHGCESHSPAKYKKDIRKGVLFYFVDSILKRNFYWGRKLALLGCIISRRW